MLICGECGSLFERARTIVERHGLDTPPYEELLVCPCCGETRIFPGLPLRPLRRVITGEYVKNAGWRPHLRRVAIPTMTAFEY